MSLSCLAALAASCLLTAAAWFLGYGRGRKRASALKAAPSVGDAEFALLLNAITEAALDTPDLKSMVQELADRMADIIHADGCYITFWDAERRISLPAAAYGTYRTSYARFRAAPGQRTLTQSIAELGRTLPIEDAYHSEYIAADIAASFESRSLLGVPMRADGAILGAVLIGFNRPHRFTPEEIERCEHAARHISFAVAKIRALEEERLLAGELLAINRIGLAIASGRDLEGVSNAIFEQCRTILDLDTFYIGLYDEARDELSFPVFYDDGKLLRFAPRNIAIQPGLSGHIIRTKASLFLPDASLPEIQEKYQVVRAGGEPARAYIGVPLLHGDRVLGVLSVQSKESSVYTTHHVQLLETIAAQSAIAIENARLYEELTLLSATDGLTGIFNFRSLSELGPREFSKARRTGRELSLVFLDIDHFRDFNAAYGHSAGNAVLRAVVSRIRDIIRSIDVFARYGGEEFVVILPETPLDEAVAIAERIRQAAAELRVMVPERTEALGVTLSLGVAAVGDDTANYQALLDAANAAERTAKENGRNRVETAGRRFGASPTLTTAR